MPGTGGRSHCPASLGSRHNAVPACRAAMRRWRGAGASWWRRRRRIQSCAREPPTGAARGDRRCGHLVPSAERVPSPAGACPASDITGSLCRGEWLVRLMSPVATRPARCSTAARGVLPGGWSPDKASVRSHPSARVCRRLVWPAWRSRRRASVCTWVDGGGYHRKEEEARPALHPAPDPTSMDVAVMPSPDVGSLDAPPASRPARGRCLRVCGPPSRGNIGPRAARRATPGRSRR